MSLSNWTNAKKRFNRITSPTKDIKIINSFSFTSFKDNYISSLLAVEVAVLMHSTHLCCGTSKHQNNAPDTTVIRVLMCLLKCRFVQLKSWKRTTKNSHISDFNGAFHILTHPEVYWKGKAKFKEKQDNRPKFHHFWFAFPERIRQLLQISSHCS